jgi:hypothetical protein
MSWIIAARSKKTGKNLYLSGNRVRDYGEPTYFQTQGYAQHKLDYLRANFPILDTYKLKIVKCPRRMRNPIPLLAMLSSPVTSAANLRENPSRRKKASNSAKIKEASSRLEDFTGHEPTEIIRAKIKEFKVGLVIGTLDAVAYTTIRDGKTERYLHEFRKRSRPLLVASYDGRSLGIVGGRFQFTEAGIVDT